jgi:hypothetical protein
MSNQEIDKKINDLKEQLINVKGNKTEIYTRIVGYFRATDGWNKGKKEEYKNRKLFKVKGEEIDKKLQTRSLVIENQRN